MGCADERTVGEREGGREGGEERGREGEEVGRERGKGRRVGGREGGGGDGSKTIKLDSEGLGTRLIILVILTYPANSTIFALHNCTAWYFKSETL